MTLSAAHNSTACADELFPVACCVACFVAPRQRQRDTHRTISLPVPAPSVCHECWSQIDIQCSRRDHKTRLLHQLHWLRAEQRVIFKVAMLAYQCIRGVVPNYLYDSLHLVADMPGVASDVGVDLGTGCSSHSSVHRW